MSTSTVPVLSSTFFPLTRADWVLGCSDGTTRQFSLRPYSLDNTFDLVESDGGAFSQHYPSLADDDKGEITLKEWVDETPGLVQSRSVLVPSLPLAPLAVRTTFQFVAWNATTVTVQASPPEPSELLSGTYTVVPVEVSFDGTDGTYLFEKAVGLRGFKTSKLQCSR